MDWKQNGAGQRMNSCADYLTEKYRAEGFKTQKIAFSEGAGSGLLVQIRNTADDMTGMLKTVIGCKNSVSVKLLRIGDDLDVSVMATTWLDKTAVLVVAWFLLWPLLATGGYGAYQQKKLIDRVQQDVTNFFANDRC